MRWLLSYCGSHAAFVLWSIHAFRQHDGIIGLSLSAHSFSFKRMHEQYNAFFYIEYVTNRINFRWFFQMHRYMFSYYFFVWFWVDFIQLIYNVLNGQIRRIGWLTWFWINFVCTEKENNKIWAIIRMYMKNGTFFEWVDFGLLPIEYIFVEGAFICLDR